MADVVDRQNTADPAVDAEVLWVDPHELIIGRRRRDSMESAPFVEKGHYGPAWARVPQPGESGVRTPRQK